MTQATADALGVTLAIAESSDTAVYSSRDARRYDPEQLALIESDTRLLKAVAVLQRYELVYGFFDDRVFIVANLWQPVPWADAIKIAESVGGHLATMTSKSENDFVFALIRYDERFWNVSPPQEGTEDFGAGGPAFGLFQEEGSREPSGGWVLVTGEPFEFQNWMPYQPNNYGGGEGLGGFGSEFQESSANRNNLAFQPTWSDWNTTNLAIIIEIE